MTTIISQHVARHPEVPEFCYSLLMSEMLDPSVKKVTPIIVKRCEKGYYATDWSWTKEYAQQCLHDINDRLGISRDMADFMSTCSIAGWPDWVYTQHEHKLAAV